MTDPGNARFELDSSCQLESTWRRCNSPVTESVIGWHCQRLFDQSDILYIDHNLNYQQTANYTLVVPNHFPYGEHATSAASFVVDKRLIELYSYVKSLPTSSDVKAKCINLWRSIAQLVSSEIQPDAAPFQNDGIMLAIDRNKHHLEFEIFPYDLPIEYFYTDSNISEADEFEDERNFGPELSKILQYFSA